MQNSIVQFIYKMLKKHFYKKNILVISFDRFKKNNDYVLKQLCKFIQNS